MGEKFMDFIEYESKQGISYIYLNRPKSFNALNRQMLCELLETIEQIENNNDSVIIVAGKGKAFSAGGDMHMLKQDFHERSSFDDVMDMIESIVLRLYQMPKIVISAVKGSAAGLGLSLALTADHVVAERQATLGMLFLGVGLVPDGGGHFWLQERMGSHQAKQFIWSMRQVQGDEAKSLGLVDELTEDKALDCATKRAKQYLVSPLQAMLKTKQIYRSQREGILKHYLAEEKEAQWHLKNTADHQEGVAAFLEKRHPVFKGK